MRPTVTVQPGGSVLIASVDPSVGDVTVTDPAARIIEIDTAPSSASNVTFVPTGTIAATNVQAAIVEVAAEANVAIPSTRVPFGTGTALDSDADLTYNVATDTLTVKNLTITGTSTIGGTTGTLANGVQVVVSSVAVQLSAANTSRATLFLQNVGTRPVRIGTTGVTAATGFRLDVGETMVFNSPYCPTNVIFAIRETGFDSTVFVQEVSSP